MMRWGRIEDQPQAEGCKTPKVERSKQGHKEPQKQREKERKAGENKKTEEKKTKKKKPKRKPISTPGGANRSSAKDLISHFR
jgi:hypothetical protein